MQLPSALFIGPKKFHEVFLAYIYPNLKSNHVNLYPPDCTTKLKYYFNRPVLKYKLFT